MTDLTFAQSAQPVQLTDDEAGALITSTSFGSSGKRGVDTRALVDFSLNKYWINTSAQIAVDATASYDLTPNISANKICDLMEFSVSQNKTLTNNNKVIPRVQLIWDATGTPEIIFDGYFNTFRVQDLHTRIIQNSGATKILRVTITNGSDQAMIFKSRLIWQEV